MLQEIDLQLKRLEERKWYLGVVKGLLSLEGSQKNSVIKNIVTYHQDSLKRKPYFEPKPFICPIAKSKEYEEIKIERLKGENKTKWITEQMRKSDQYHRDQKAFGEFMNDPTNKINE